MADEMHRFQGEFPHQFADILNQGMVTDIGVMRRATMVAQVGNDAVVTFFEVPHDPAPVDRGAEQAVQEKQRRIEFRTGLPIVELHRGWPLFQKF